MSELTSAISVSQVAPHRAKSGYIISPVSDILFIIGAPLLAVLISLPLFAIPKSACMWTVLGQSRDIRHLFLLVFSEAHLVLVFFRSHGNEKIFRTYPLQFTLVPIVLLVSMTYSPYVFGIVGIVGVWWDVYHSSLQTFGFGRIYDAKQKNSPTAGRRLDYWMNLLLYTGPVLAGTNFVEHMNFTRAKLSIFEVDDSSFGELLYRSGPEFLILHQNYLTLSIIGIGIPFLVYYLYSYYRLQQQGYHVSWQKVCLYLITGSVSVYGWGFHSFFNAYWVMNFFHAVQYFAIVISTEKQNLSRLFRVDRFPYGAVIAGFWVVVLCFLYGWWGQYQATGTWMASLFVTTSIMHFWYDGFIWSVKKRQV